MFHLIGIDYSQLELRPSRQQSERKGQGQLGRARVRPSELEGDREREEMSEGLRAVPEVREDRS